MLDHHIYLGAFTLPLAIGPVRRVDFKDSRAVAFEVTLKAARAAGCLDAVDATGATPLCRALAAKGPAVPKRLEALEPPKKDFAAPRHRGLLSFSS